MLRMGNARIHVHELIGLMSFILFILFFIFTA